MDTNGKRTLQIESTTSKNGFPPPFFRYLRKKNSGGGGFAPPVRARVNPRPAALWAELVI